MPLQEDKKTKSVRTLNEESRDELGDKKRNPFFSWSRKGASFGKGTKKRDLADFNLSE